MRENSLIDVAVRVFADRVHVVIAPETWIRADRRPSAAATRAGLSWLAAAAVDALVS